MRNKLKKLIKPKFKPIEVTVTLKSGYKKKKFIKQKKITVPPITYYPNGKKD